MNFRHIRYVADANSDPDQAAVADTVALLGDGEAIANTVPYDGWTGVLGGVAGTLRLNPAGEWEFLIAPGPAVPGPPGNLRAVGLRLRAMLARMAAGEARLTAGETRLTSAEAKVANHETRLAALETRMTAAEAAIAALQHPLGP